MLVQVYQALRPRTRNGQEEEALNFIRPKFRSWMITGSSWGRGRNRLHHLTMYAENRARYNIILFCPMFLQILFDVTLSRTIKNAPGVKKLHLCKVSQDTARCVSYLQLVTATGCILEYSAIFGLEQLKVKSARFCWRIDV